MSLSEERALDALVALGLAWRGDWSQFDGRTLRDELYSWRTLMEQASRGEATPQDAERWADSQGVCIICGSWHEYCVGREGHRPPATGTRSQAGATHKPGADIENPRGEA